MLHSDLRAQFTFPHLCAVKLIILGVIFIIAIYNIWVTKWTTIMIQPSINTYVLHCQSFALKRPLLFSARVFPISVPPAFIIFASVVLSAQQKENVVFILHIKHLYIMYIMFLYKGRLTSTTSVTTSPSGKIHVSTSTKQQHRQKKQQKKKELDCYSLI